MSRARAKRRRAGPLVAGALAAVAACGVTEVPMPPDGDVAALGGILDLSEGARIAYVGAFDWEEAVQNEGSVTFENDLGFQFRIDDLQLATTSIQLRLCEPEEEASWLGWRIRSAYADHIVDNDPSMAIVDRAEDALSTSRDEWAVGTASGGAYCLAFLLSAGLSEPAPGLGDNTIALTGAYLDPDAEASDDASWVPFDARVPLGDGMLEELVPETDPRILPTGSGDADVEILVTRYPVRAFQSLDPRSLDSAELAWEVLGNVLHRSTVHYRPR